MKIAILGWGSLIWDSLNLEIDASQGDNGWFNAGPVLPIEFSRISQDGRLTLVIDPNGAQVHVLYAVSTFMELDHAILDLAVREGCGKNKIGSFVRAESKCSPAGFRYQKSIKTWLAEMEDVDAVIWTNLPKNFKDKINLPCSPENAVNYLKYQPNDIKIKAEQYIRRAPSIVKTSIRTAIETEFGWRTIS